MSQPQMALMVCFNGVEWIWEEVPEDIVETAMDLGWHLVLRQSDLQPPSIEPNQRNVNRSGDTGEDA